MKLVTFIELGGKPMPQKKNIPRYLSPYRKLHQNSIRVVQVVVM
jgi:hypothetical protein